MNVFKKIFCLTFIAILTGGCINGLYSQDGSISGYVWFDQDYDQMFDNGEFGLTERTIELISGSDTLTTQTVMDGSYSFDNLVPGTYLVSIIDVPLGLELTTSAQLSIQLTDINISTQNNFGLAAVTSSQCSDFVITSASATSSLCTLTGTGTIAAAWVGGNAPFQVFLNNNSITSVNDNSVLIENLSAGDYELVIQESSVNQCLLSSLMTIELVGGFDYNVDIPDFYCAGTEGQIAIIVSNIDTETINIGLENGFQSTIAPDDTSYITVASGDHQLTIDNGSGCAINYDFYMPEAVSSLATTVSTNSPSICGASDGNAIINVEGGSGNYTITSDEGTVIGTTINGLVDGSYSVTINDTECAVSTPVNFQINDPFPCVVAENHAPCADTAYVCIPMMTTYTFCIEQCDPDGDHLTIVDHSVSLYDCAIHLQGDTCVKYTPLPAFQGSDYFTLLVCDDADDQLCSQWLVNMFVGTCNLEAVQDFATTDAGVPVTINVVANDDSPLNVPFHIISVSTPDNGTTSISSDSLNIIYTPNPGYSGGDSFSYTIIDDNGLPATALVVVTINASDCLAIAGTVLGPIEDCIPLGGMNMAPSVSGENDNDGFIYLYLLTDDLFTGDDLQYNILDWNNTGSFDFGELGLGAGTFQVQGFNYQGTIASFQALNVESGDALLDMIAAQTICGALITPGYTVEVNAGDCGGNTGGCESEFEYCGEPMVPLEMCFGFCDIIGTGAVIDSVITSWHCSITINSDTCVTYTALPGFVGRDSVIAIACNSLGICDTAVAYINVGCMSPVAMPDSYQVVSGESMFLDILANDSDPCDRSLISQVMSYPQNGNLISNNNGFLYVPDEGYTGVDSFTYLACNDCTSPMCSNTTVTIEVIDDITPPSGLVLSPDIAYTSEGEMIIVNVLNNDVGTDLTISGISQGNNGTVSINTDNNTITYTPNDGFIGTDYFFYTACDMEGNCSVTYVSVIVSDPNSPNQSPNANNDTAITTDGSTIIIDVTSNDTDPENSELTITDIINVSCGTATIVNNEIQYIPDANCDGDETLDYIICDQSSPALCDTATVLIGVNEAPSNNPPLAISDTVWLANIASIIFNISDNDVDPDGDNLNYIIGASANCGTMELDPSGIALYIPENDCEGDLIMYIVCDNASVALCDTAYVLINYPSNNLPLVAQTDVVTTPFETAVEICILDNDSGTNFALSTYSTPSNGSISVNPDNGCLIYTPISEFEGVDYFSYTICDDENNCDETIVAITVFEEGINLPPVASNDVIETAVDVPAVVYVLANDSDPENGVLTITDVNVPITLADVVSGTSINGDGSIVINTVPGYTGQFVITYTICDDQDQCSNADILVVIGGGEPQNNPPVGENDVADLAFGENGTICVMDNDTDPDDDFLSISILSDPANGSVIINSDGCIEYTPSGEFLGADYLTYLLCDSGTPTLCDTAYLTINITAAPGDTIVIANDDRAETLMNDSLHTLVFVNDIVNPTSASVTFDIIDQPSNGVLTIENDDTQDVFVIYEPNFNFVGEDTFYYALCVNQICDTAQVIIYVLPTTEECDISVLNGLSPNSDGYGDQLDILATGCEYEYMNVKIYNRWGNEVYSSIDYPNQGKWTGLWDKNDNEVPDGTYFYIVELILDGQKIKEKAGYIEILR